MYATFTIQYIKEKLLDPQHNSQFDIGAYQVDLVPVWVTQKWIGILSKDHPTLAFHASLTNSFGKGEFPWVTQVGSKR